MRGYDPMRQYGLQVVMDSSVAPARSGQEGGASYGLPMHKTPSSWRCNYNPVGSKYNVSRESWYGPAERGRKRRKHDR